MVDGGRSGSILCRKNVLHKKHKMNWRVTTPEGMSQEANKDCIRFLALFAFRESESVNFRNEEAVNPE